MRGVVFVVLAGCGRIGFDAGALDGRSSDTAGDSTRDGANGDVLLANHDEDGDGIDDAIDPCPHLPGNLDDADGDGVGDACDPIEGVAQRIVLFDPFTSLDPSVQLQNGWQLGADQIDLATTSFAAINRTFTVGEADIWIGVTVATLPAGDHQILIHASNGTEQPRYYGQLYTTTTIRENAIISYDDTTYVGIDTTPLPSSGIPLGDITLHLRVEVGGNARWVTSWADVAYETSGPIPAYTGSPRVRLAMGGVTGAARYLCIIAPQ